MVVVIRSGDTDSQRAIALSNERRVGKESSEKISGRIGAARAEELEVAGMKKFGGRTEVLFAHPR